MKHVSEELISAYIDGQLAGEEKAALESHVNICHACRARSDDMLEVTRLFRQAERLEPSPYLWTRIESELQDEPPSSRGWRTMLLGSMRERGWGLRLAAATAAVLLLGVVIVFQQHAGYLSEQAALAEIDRAHGIWAAQDPDVYNPFRVGPLYGSDANPFSGFLGNRNYSSRPPAPGR